MSTVPPASDNAASLSLPDPFDDVGTRSPSTEAPARTGHRLALGAGDVGRFLLYSLLALVLGLLAFSLVLTLLAAGAVTVVIWIGLPILVAGVLVARGFAAAERSLQHSLLGTDLPTPRPRRAAEEAGWVRRMLTPLADPQSWMNCLWTPVNLVAVLATFPIALAWTLGAIGTVAGPVATLILEQVLPAEQRSGLPELMGMTGTPALVVDLGGQVLIGLLFLLTVVPVTRGLTAVHRGIARGLLSSRYAEQQQLERAERSRAAGRLAESAALRRLERDLHDGPQQRLVRASMDLARAEQAAGTDPERTQEMLRGTRTQLAETLDELRRLSRGIAPPVLVDRGLPGALAELAAICPVPARVECPDLDLPEHVEIGAYYVVSEALTNVAKHSGAEAVRVQVLRRADTLHVEVVDDGRGGAATSPGGGLAGLVGRVAALEGELRIESPLGGGTRLEAVIPCGS